MRIAVLTDNDFAKVNGVTTTLKAVLAYAPTDVSARIYTFADSDCEEQGYTALASAGILMPFCGEMGMYAPRVGALRAKLLAHGVEAIHMTTPGPSGLVARYLARTLRVPLIGSFHTELGEYTRCLSGSQRLASAMESYMRWLYGACARVLVPSAATARRLKMRGWQGARLAVWPRGVDAQRFTPARRSAALRAHWKVSDRRPAILYAGRLSREKGLDLLEPLCALLAEYRMPHRLVFCGDGPLRGRLEAMFPDAVFAGTVPHEAVGEIMASADLFLFPSETDTAGNVVLEAQAAGLPVLVSSEGGPRENMIDRVTGYVCRASSPEDFCWRVAELVVDPGRRKTMGRAARQYATGRDWPAAMAPLFSCYREMIPGAETEAAGVRPVPPCATATA